MDGVISVLDVVHTRQVRELWQEIDGRFHISNPLVTFAPHFSYHIAESYDVAKVASVLREVAQQTAVFTVAATGIGIFPGADPVVYIPIARNAALAALQETLWTAVNPISQAPSAYYQPPNWLPHITLVQSAKSPIDLGPLVKWLHRQSISWEIRVSSIGFAQTSNGRSQVKLTQSLSA